MGQAGLEIAVPPVIAGLSWVVPASACDDDDDVVEELDDEDDIANTRTNARPNS